MSKTYSLVCPTTKRSFWIGTGSGAGYGLYRSEAHIAAFGQWLLEHKGKELLFVDDDETGDEGDEYTCDNIGRGFPPDGPPRNAI